jgi:hypothetical protein
VLGAPWFLTAISVLLLAFGSLKLAAAFGYARQYLDILEKIHLIFFGILTFMFGLDMVVKIAVKMVAKGRTR